MAAGTMVTEAAAAVLLYYVLSRRLAAKERNRGGDLSKSNRSVRRRIVRRPAQAPATWIETITTLSETLRFTYSETSGKWPIADLAFGINYLMRKQGNLQVASVSAGTESVQLRGPEIITDIKDTLTAATGAVVPFHHSVLDDGGISNLVLGYAHCGMVAAARWIAKLSTPCLLKALGEYPLTTKLRNRSGSQLVPVSHLLRVQLLQMED